VRKLALTVVALAVVLVVAVAVVTMRVIVRPQTQTPARADAVVVISGDRGERVALALDLMRRGVARTLVLAGQFDFPQATDLCKGGQAFEVVCLMPQPDSTRDEARATGQLAESRSWREIAVITAPWHVARSRLLFGRCFDGSVQVVAVEPPIRLTASLVVREWLGLAHAQTLARGC
jgi:uncharacterized SAM-binding protein YcdF (DUF218 family)